jgi:hypothetical protein
MRLVFSVTLIVLATASGVDKGLTDGLADRADAVVAGAVQSGRQNGTNVTFSLAVDRTIKGNLLPGQILTIYWQSPLVFNRDLTGKYYGLWFLAKNTDSSLQLLSVTQGKIALERAYLPLSSVYAPASAAAISGSTTGGRIAAELLTAMQHCTDYEQLRTLGHGLFGIADSSTRGPVFQVLRASSDPEVKFLGLAGLAKDGDASALAEMAKGASIIPSLRTGEFSLSVIGSMRTGDPGAVQALGTFAASANRDMQRSAADALCYIHTRDTLPFLALLLNSPDRQTIEYAIRGMSRFVNNLPIDRWEDVPSGKNLVPQGSAPFKTIDTDRYSLAMRVPSLTEDLGPYVQFWKSWWLRMKDQLGSK